MYVAIGCGKCGCSLVDAFWAVENRYMRYLCLPVAINSAYHDFVRLKHIKPRWWLGIANNGEPHRPVTEKGAIDPGFAGKISGGLGKDFQPGNDAFNRGQKSIADRLHEIIQPKGGKFDEEINLAVVFYGLAGATGGGGGPVVAEALRREGIPVIVVAVLPAPSEGDGFAWNAYRSLRETVVSADGVMLVDNALIDRGPGLSAQYRTFNETIARAVSDLILGAVSGGPRMTHAAMKSHDYRDLITSLKLPSGRGIGVISKATYALSWFGDANYDVPEWLRRSRRQMLVVKADRPGVKQVAGIITLHSSVARSGHFPFAELERAVTDMTAMHQAYIGFNETRDKLMRFTFCWTYDPDDISRLFDLRQRANNYLEASGASEKIPGERIFGDS